jgi:hypothetical protein
MKKAITENNKATNQPIVSTGYEPTLEIFTDLKKIAKGFRKDRKGLEAFVEDSKNKITVMLIEFTKKRRLIQDLKRKTASQVAFNNVIYNEDEIWGEVHLAISALLKQWSANFMNMVDKGRPLAHSSGKGAVRLEKANDLCGYYRNSLSNGFADLFIKYHALKRDAAEVNFSSMYPESDEENERNFEDTIASSSSNDVIIRSYKRDMINHLRSYDKKSGTRVAHLFVALMNPRYNGAVTVIQSKLGINNKNFNENKAVLERLLKEEFGDISQELMTHFELKRGAFEDLEKGNKASRKYKNRKKQKMLEKKANKPCRLNLIYGQRKDKNGKCVYYVTVMVDRSKTIKEIAYSPDNWENIFKKEEVLAGKPNQMDKMKPKLEKMIRKELEEAQKIANISKNKSSEIDDMSLAA